MRDFSVVKIESVDCGNTFINGESSIEEDIKACRVCLTTKGKLFNLHVNNLAEAFGDISGTPVVTTDGYPQYVCVKCRVLLLKCLAFRLCCQQTLMQLQHLRLQTAPVTTELISTLQQTEIIPLVLTKTLNLEYLPSTEEVQSPVSSVQRHEKLVVKNESFIELSPEEDDLMDDGNFDVGFKEDNDDNNFKVDDLLGNIHEAEIVDAQNVKLENDVIENTDISYSLRKGKKRKKAPEKNVKVKKKPIKKLKKIETEDEITDSEVKLEELTDAPKTKRLYNRKTEEDFVSFSKTFNVEVVFLSREQQIQQVQSRKDCEDFINSRFQCDMCYKSFMKESAYKKHMVTHDLSSGTHVCDICFVRFPVRHKLMKHLRRHKTHFICKFCSQISKDSTMAKMHYKWHEGFKYNCQHCGRSFSKPSSYMNHVRENHSPITCEVCQQAVSGTRGMAAHKADAHSGYNCQHCGRSFSKPSSYMNHVRENHSPITCEVCQQAVSGTRGMAAHKADAHSGMHKCPTCAMEFHSPAALARHGGVGVAGVGVGVAPCGSLAPCARCGAELVTADALANHLETEHGDKVYRCELCKTTYSSDRQLGIHWSRAHKGQRRAARARDDHYMCELCANSYPNETTLRYHQRIHTGERPFQCPMCPKKFRLKTNLQVHINTHTGARPYKCPLCPETFKSYSQKHKHRLLVHTKERRHKCHMCEKTYVVSFDLKTHIRTAHMKIPLPPRARRRDRRRDTNPSVSNMSNTNININT